jgi:hypothetical protein
VRNEGLRDKHTVTGALFVVEDVMIKRVHGGYKVVSEKGKNLGGPYKTKQEAEKRLRAVEYFKQKKT